MPKNSVSSMFELPLRMFRKLMPTEVSFVDAFSAQAKMVSEAATIFRGVLANPQQEGETGYQAIRIVEKRADTVYHKTMDDIRSIYLTPKGMDKDDIGDLSECMDDVIDLMKDAAKRFRYYGAAFPAEILEMGDCIVEAAIAIDFGIPLLHDIAGNSDRLLAMRTKVGEIESKADAIQDRGLLKFYAGAGSAGEKLTMERIYDLVEEVCDKLEDVSKLVARIVSQAV